MKVSHVSSASFLRSSVATEKELKEPLYWVSGSRLQPPVATEKELKDMLETAHDVGDHQVATEKELKVLGRHRVCGTGTVL